MNNYEFLVGDKTLTVHAEKIDDTIVVKAGENTYRFLPVGENLFRVSHNGQMHIIAAVKSKDVIYVDIDSSVFEIHEAGAAQSVASTAAHNIVRDKVFAPMPGKIVKVMVKKGDTVLERQPLAVIEAMKMENQINSPASGRVKAVNFSAGDQVNTTSPIIELELEPTS